MGRFVGEETGPIPLDLRFKMILLDYYYLVEIDNMNMKKSIIKMSSSVSFLTRTTQLIIYFTITRNIFSVHWHILRSHCWNSIDYRRHCHPLDFTAPSTDPPSS